MQKHPAFEEQNGVATQELLHILRQSRSIESFTRRYRGEFLNFNLKEYLENLLLRKNLKKADVIRASNISEVYAYQIFAGLKNPSRDKLLALAVAIGLTLEECQHLLKLAEAGELYVKTRRDAVVIFGLIKQLNIHQLNELLYELEELTI